MSTLIENWTLIGGEAELRQELTTLEGLKEVTLNEKRILLTLVEGKLGAISARCNHMGGPLAKGKLKKNCVECPWHYWSFNAQSGEADHKTTEPLAPHGGAISSYPLKIEGGSVYVDVGGETPRVKPTYGRNVPGMYVARKVERAPGKIRVVGISTTAMDKEHPRYSTSEDLLRTALKRGAEELDIEYQVISLSELNFRHCEGFYSKSERACTWPCSITKMDASDEMHKIYEALVHWGDVVVVATPIRWGGASSLYYKMVERLNSVQNHMLHGDSLINNKVASFIITGGQDNIQAVAGQMHGFFSELGFVTPAFGYVAHSLGWSAEEMEHNMDYVKRSEKLHTQSFELLERSVDLAKKLVEG